MEKFVVSARKYRPDRFDKVVGQGNITNTLKNAIKHNHLAQAFLFSGPRGVGKTTVARLLAKALNCTNMTDDIEPCNACESCRSFNELASFNVHELDAASNNSVEDIRSLVDQVRIPPQAGDYKVYIIDEVHMLSTAAFNAFLKTLEEPPSYAKFILATTEKHKIIPTILSRCQSYDFQRITVEEIKNQLMNVSVSEAVKAEPEALQMIAQKADGALRDALSIFDQVVNYAGGEVTYQHVIENLNILDYDYYFRLTEHFLLGSIHDSLLLYEEIVVKGFAGQQFLNGLGTHLRNLLVCRDEKTVKLLEVGVEIREKYLEYAIRFSTEALLEMIEVINKADLSYRNAANKRLQVELALMQICSLASTEKKTLNPGEPEGKYFIKPSASEDRKKMEKPSDGNSSGSGEKPGASPEEKNKPPTTSQGKPQGDPPATENPEEPVTIKQQKARMSTVSLKQDIKQKQADELAEDYEKVPEGPVKEVDMEAFNLAMEEYTQKEKELKPSFVTDVLNSNPIQLDKTTVELSLSNKLYKGADYILDLQRFLRNKLNNPFLVLKTNIQEQKSAQKVFTSKEKYEKIKVINPQFENFKQQLDLDYE
ncbi:MAG: DNA polymerase III subunit gamma/tau [Bacteroidales bacterium]